MPIGNISLWSQTITFVTSYTANHEEIGLSRLLEQYKGQPIIEALIKSYITNQIQDLEDTLVQLATVLSIPLSSGVQLDNIGDIVGQPRQGFDDVKYRRILTAKIGQNVSQGDIEIIIDIWQKITEATLIEIVELFPATIRIFSDVELDEDELDFFHDFLQKAMPAAVKFAHFGKFPEDDDFAFAETDDGDLAPYTPVISADKGFGDSTDPGYGGNFYGTQK